MRNRLHPIFWIISILSIAFAAFWFKLDERRFWKLQETGLLSTGEVTEAWVSTYKGGHTCNVAYKFSVDNKNIARRVDMPVPFCLQVSSGSKVLVRYLPGDPSFNRLLGERERSALAFLTISGIGWLLMGLEILLINRFKEKKVDTLALPRGITYCKPGDAK